MRPLERYWLYAGFVCLGVTLVAGAMQLKETIASPRSVPTDVLPPFGMLDDSGRLIPIPDISKLPPGMLAAPTTAPARASVPKGIALDLAIEAARASVDTCAKNGFSSAAAVVDAEGKPLATLSVGSEGSIFVAIRKAVTTLAFRMPSSRVESALAQDQTTLARMTPVMFISGGALPLWRGKQLIGAIASSGAHGAGPIGAQDEICAQAGLDKIKSRLP